MRVIPTQPVHGFTFAHLLINSLALAGYLAIRDNKKGGGYNIIREDFDDLSNDELEEIIQEYLYGVDT